MSVNTPSNSTEVTEFPGLSQETFSSLWRSICSNASYDQISPSNISLCAKGKGITEVTTLLNWLIRSGYLDKNSEGSYTITSKGWSKYNEMNK